MSNFGYKHLQEDTGSSATSGRPWTATFPEMPLNESVLISQNGFESSQTVSRESSSSKVTKLWPKEKSEVKHSKGENAKYKPMKPIASRVLREHDIEQDCVDPENMNYKMNARLIDKKRMSISRVHIAICGLLISCVVLVAFAVIYVFIILPSFYKGEIRYPDGQNHLSNMAQSLGENVVTVGCGSVQGDREKGAYVFKGIPYAFPPTGSRRWMPPVPQSRDANTCWNDIFNATMFGNKCVQPKISNTSAIEGREDCLYINVWTPSLNPLTPLPVMVWFHSGDFVYGSGHMPGMSPTPEIAMATNSVYVSFNYRLGAFGFLALDALREKSKGAAGNYGFMDQQLALTWVKENIRQFGGNENMVTIFGHGSGATSVHAMLSSSGSGGLFHKAWLTSPVAVLNKTVEEACRDNKLFLAKSGCHDAQCLRALSPEVVSRSSPWSLEAHWTLDQLFSIPRKSQLRNDLPIFDGHVVHRSSQKSGPDGPMVPVVFGTTYFDLSSLETEEAVVNMTWKDYEIKMAQFLGTFGKDAISKAKSLYAANNTIENNPTHFPSAPSTQFTHIIGDIKDVCPVKILADDFVYLYSGSAPVYMYVAEIYPSQNIKHTDIEKDTFVGWDIAAFFGSYQDFNFRIGQGEVNFQGVLREEIMSFVKSSHPDASRWNTADVNFGIISHDVTITPVTSEYFFKCNLWEQYQFFRYTWNVS